MVLCVEQGRLRQYQGCDALGCSELHARYIDEQVCDAPRCSGLHAHYTDGWLLAKWAK